jgi:hypothetical protein
MNQSHSPVTCEEFQRELPEFMVSGAELCARPHLENTVACRTLIIDLDSIAATAPKQPFPGS